MTLTLTVELADDKLFLLLYSLEFFFLHQHVILFRQDMSAYVKKIQFKLHESYGNPLRG